MKIAKLHFPDSEREALITAFAKIVRSISKPGVFEITIGEGPGLCGEGAWSIAASEPGEPQGRRRQARPAEPHR